MIDRKHEFYFWLAIFVVVLIVVGPVWWQVRKDYEHTKQILGSFRAMETNAALDRLEMWLDKIDSLDTRDLIAIDSLYPYPGMMDQAPDTLAVWLDTDNTVFDTLEILDDARWKQIEENFLLSK